MLKKLEIARTDVKSPENDSLNVLSWEANPSRVSDSLLNALSSIDVIRPLLLASHRRVCVPVFRFPASRGVVPFPSEEQLFLLCHILPWKRKRLLHRQFCSPTYPSPISRPTQLDYRPWVNGLWNRGAPRIVGVSYEYR